MNNRRGNVILFHSTLFHSALKNQFDLLKDFFKFDSSDLAGTKEAGLSAECSAVSGYSCPGMVVSHSPASTVAINLTQAERAEDTKTIGFHC